MLLKVSEVAALLRLGKPQVRKMCELGLLKSVKLGQRGLRVDKNSVDEYLRLMSHGEISLQNVETPRA